MGSPPTPGERPPDTSRAAAPLGGDASVFRALFESAPGGYLVLTADDYRIVAVSDAYLEAVRARREDLLGRRVFEVFPLDHPSDPEALAGRTLKASLERVKERGAREVLPVQRYPLPRPASEGGGFEARYWSTVNVPVPGPDGKAAFLIHRAEDVTEFVIRQMEETDAGAPGGLEASVERQEADVVLKAWELERLNRALVADLDRLRRVFEGAAVGIAVLSPESRFLQVNPAVCSITGYTEDEILATSLEAISHPDDRPRNRALLHELVEGTRPDFVIETRLLTEDEKNRWTRLSVSALRTEHGPVTRLVAVCEDISERKQAEAEATRLEDRLLTTLESITDAFFTLDREWRFTYLNREAEGLLRRSRQELLGTVVWDEFPEARDSAFRREYERAVETGTPVRFEAHYPPLDTWFDVHAYPSEEGLAVYFQDVTETRRSRQALEESETRYRTLVEASPDAVWVVAEGFLVMANPAAVRLLGGRDAGDLVGQPLLRFVHPDYRDVVERRVEAVLEGAAAPLLEQKVVRMDGSEIDVEVMSAPLTWKGDPAVQVIARDVTERNRLQDQFLRAQRLESIGTLAGGIAHDLNNVLAPVLMSVDLLRVAENDRERDEILTAVETSTTRGADLVRQVLTFARGVEGEHERLSPAEVVGELQAMIRETFPRSIRLETEVPSDAWPVQADPTQLQQVLLNLCVNARDAMPEGGTLRVSVRNTVLAMDHVHGIAHRARGPHVVFEVRDTGTGVPEEIQDRIFDPFFTTKEVGQGTGLGLSTALAIVRSHRGFLDVDSRPGEGASFRAHFPAEPGLPVRDREAPAPASALPRGSGQRIMIVDDEPAVRSIARRTLEAFGFRVVLAEGGREAVDRFRELGGDVDVVITDLNMPEMDGPATVAALREVRPDVRVVAMSGLGAGPDFGGVFGSGVHHFLAKPFSAAELLEVLETVLDGG
jgi:two-component system, cell cycle sensor histidine kinase and response regulator CckA